ncbi:MAG: hypothetical protein PHN68_05740, partial [Prolixibacteraceae bacterium]|nr:hypothetical protein [Prolixibacteraceae bacterium]
TYMAPHAPRPGLFPGSGSRARLYGIRCTATSNRHHEIDCSPLISGKKHFSIILTITKVVS